MTKSQFVADQAAAWSTNISEVRQKMIAKAADLVARVVFCVGVERDSAERRFVEPDGSARGRELIGAAELLGSDALRRDPTDFLPSGEALGLVALPAIVRSDPADYYQRHRPTHRGFMIPPGEIKEILKRAWGPTSSGDEAPTVP